MPPARIKVERSQSCLSHDREDTLPSGFTYREDIQAIGNRMRDKQRTIESLRRLAERPGTPQEGETARKKLREMEAKTVSKERPERPVEPNIRYVHYEGEVDIDLLREILGVKTARNTRVKPTATWQDVESAMRRHIYKDQGDPE